jgi:oxygen-independent coproporphyrinogen-3 oxidase
VADPTVPGFGIYVHWPFCAAKCPYCDFNSHVRHNAPDQARFARAFAAEIEHMAAMQPGRTITSVFFGGGTPSLMEPATVETILTAIHTAWPVEDDAEITMEANPSSADAGRFSAYRGAGVNRMSLGVQSLHDAELKRLGRLHNAAEARAAIDLARKTFPRLSFDLIYARPNQTLAGWRAELEEAIALAADHLSLYQLTIEEGTPFFDLHRRGRLIVPNEDHAADLYALTQQITADHGLPAYEISNHAQPGCESRHNLTYWRSGAWAGIGPGAHGRLDMNDGRRATANERHPETWLGLVESQGHGMVTNEPLGTDDAGEEMLLMGLRLVEGLDVPRYEALSGKRLDPERVETLRGYGMVSETSSGRLRATQQGRMVLNSVIAELAA